MKKITITKDRYVKKIATIKIDGDTILYLCGKVIKEEYGRQGSVAIVPRAYVRKTLVLQVTNTLWAQEIWIRREVLTQLINKRCGGEYVEKVSITAE